MIILPPFPWKIFIQVLGALISKKFLFLFTIRVLIISHQKTGPSCPESSLSPLLDYWEGFFTSSSVLATLTVYALHFFRSYLESLLYICFIECQHVCVCVRAYDTCKYIHIQIHTCSYIHAETQHGRFITV